MIIYLTQTGYLHLAIILYTASPVSQEASNFGINKIILHH